MLLADFHYVKSRSSIFLFDKNGMGKRGRDRLQN